MFDKNSYNFLKWNALFLESKAMYLFAYLCKKWFYFQKLNHNFVFLSFLCRWSWKTQNGRVLVTPEHCGSTNQTISPESTMEAEKCSSLLSRCQLTKYFTTHWCCIVTTLSTMTNCVFNTTNTVSIDFFSSQAYANLWLKNCQLNIYLFHSSWQ